MLKFLILAALSTATTVCFNSKTFIIFSQDYSVLGNDAEDLCARNGGRLAHISCNAERDFLSKRLIDDAYIGGYLSLKDEGGLLITPCGNVHGSWCLNCSYDEGFV